MEYLSIVIIVVLAGGIAFFVKVFLEKNKKMMAQVFKQAESVERQKNASYANALIVSLEGGIMGQQSAKARMKLTLNVFASTPKAYIVTTTWLVDITALDLLKAGNELSVKIDSQNPQIIYPAAPWATYISL